MDTIISNHSLSNWFDTASRSPFSLHFDVRWIFLDGFFEEEGIPRKRGSVHSVALDELVSWPKQLQIWSRPNISRDQVTPATIFLGLCRSLISAWLLHNFYGFVCVQFYSCFHFFYFALCLPLDTWIQFFSFITISSLLLKIVSGAPARPPLSPSLCHPIVGFFMHSKRQSYWRCAVKI